jgi:uncharacterized protein (DUF302 family)
MDSEAMSHASAKTSGAPGDRPINEHSYSVRRLTVPVADYRAFRSEYEEVVPDLPLDAVLDLVRRNAPWTEMMDLIERTAPFGFLIYFRNDVAPVMALAGDRAECVAYLMGNHTIAERMFRIDPRAMLYAPLHTVIWEDHEGAAWFTVDQPSSQFASFGISEIADVGRELDRKLAALLTTLNVPVPQALIS